MALARRFTMAFTSPNWSSEPDPTVSGPIARRLVEFCGSGRALGGRINQRTGCTQGSGAVLRVEQGTPVMAAGLECHQVAQLGAELRIDTPQKLGRCGVVGARVTLTGGREADRVAGGDAGEHTEAHADVDGRPVLGNDELGDLEVLGRDPAPAAGLGPVSCSHGQLLRAHRRTAFVGVDVPPADATSVSMLGPCSRMESDNQEATMGSS